MKVSWPHRPKVRSVFATALRTCPSARPRRGIAALIVLACLSLATIVGTLLLQAALSEQRYLNRLELQSQGEWLAEAGFSRAAAQLAKSPHYSGETWTIPGSSFGRTQNAIVRIAVSASPAEASPRHVDVTATFSLSNEPAIQVSRDFSTR
jgi:type II secretory pathway component PulK